MITVLDRQSIFDLALQHFGSAEAALDIAMSNDMKITDIINGELSMMNYQLSKSNKKVVEYYTINKITPATEVTESLTFEGIDYWIIEDDFVIQ